MCNGKKCHVTCEWFEDNVEKECTEHYVQYSKSRVPLTPGAYNNMGPAYDDPSDEPNAPKGGHVHKTIPTWYTWGDWTKRGFSVPKGLTGGSPTVPPKLGGLYVKFPWVACGLGKCRKDKGLRWWLMKKVKGVWKKVSEVSEKTARTMKRFNDGFRRWVGLPT